MNNIDNIPMSMKRPYNLPLSTWALERFYNKILASSDAIEYNELAKHIKKVIKYMYKLQSERKLNETSNQ